MKKNIDLEKKGILLVNLGSPNSPSSADVKRYLREFLSDSRVVTAPYLIRKFIVEALILPRRPKRSAEAYQKIWLAEGSPLIVISQRLKEALSERLPVPISLSMRYGNPTIPSGLNDLYEQGIWDVLIFPLYPQYAMSTSESVIVEVLRIRKKYFRNMKISFFPPFYRFQRYLDAFEESILAVLPERVDHILFSYHGVPEKHIYKTDRTGHCKIDDVCCGAASEAHVYCYRHQCYETTRGVVARLGFPSARYSTSFQSRLGNDAWLRPYTDEILKSLADSGVRNLAVVAPAFTTDCLETLEEIAIGGKSIFLQAGGENFTYIPCLNTREAWVKTLSYWCKAWLEKGELFG
ncbi:MAG: ferrochelatase [Flavobacteriales bacterium Tduv]